MNNPMLDLLRQFVRDNNVQMLQCVEAGSRAWGFASPDSDFDVRFIYRHNGKDNYIALDDPTDVLQFTKGLWDYSGWDIKKTLRLARKSNVSLYEWCNSPIQYMDESLFTQELREYVNTKFCLNQMAEHYRGIAKSTYRQHLEGTGEKTFKKYLYVIRCILAVKYIIEFNQMPPVDFNTLYLRMADMDDVPQHYIAQLVEVKKLREERAMILSPITSFFDTWMSQAIQYYDSDRINQHVQKREADTAQLDALFRKYA